MLGGGIITPNIQERKNGNMKRKGFTLVELLIVIVVIGILSAMMMMSSTEATTSAKVTAIVSNLRNLKTAGLAFYTDHMDDVANDKITDTELNDSTTGVWAYLSAGDAIPDMEQYHIRKTASGGKDTGGWYITYNIKGSAAETASIKKKLLGRTNSLGLLQATSKTSVQVDTPYDGVQNWVGFKIR